MKDPKKFIREFSQLNKSNIPVAGGKGSNLGELTSAGFSVPPGFVLTTAAYNAFVQIHGLQPQIVDLAQTVSADDPLSAERASNQITALFLEREVPVEVVDELRAAFKALDASAVAVRSSATAEDLPSASFAGQQDTYLNIQGEVDLLNAVRRCWASLWTSRAIAYRQRQGIAPERVSLAVIVQQLVAADSSGILFTADPTTGERDRILINATWGLGEAIVGGAVTPDTIIIDKTTWGIVSQETAQKSVMTVRTESGTEEREVPAELQSAPSLSDQTAVELAQIGQNIEAHYGAPMDIEWAIADGKIAILQARPITFLPAAPLKDVVWEPPTPNTIWMRRQIVEHMPEPLSPLFEDLYVRRGLSASVNGLMTNMTSLTNLPLDLDKMMPQGFADTINGYAYTTSTVTLDWSNILAILAIYPRLFKMTALPEFDWDNVVMPTYLALIDRWDSVDLAEAEDETLLNGMSELATADSAYWWGSAISLGLSRALDPFFDRLLKSFLFRSALPQNGIGSSAFMRGFDSKALDAQADLEKIADLIRDSEALRGVVLSTPAAQLLPLLTNRPEAETVLRQIERYLTDYGHQIYNLDFAEPTQGDDPRPILLSLKSLVQNAPAESARVRQAKLARERDLLVEQTEQRLNPPARALFRWVWKWVKQYGPYREQVMFYLGSAWPTVRRMAAELGGRLTRGGSIPDAADIYYLERDEIALALNAIASGGEVPDFSDRVAARRSLRDSQKLLTPQPKVPAGSTLKVGPFTLSMFDPTPTDPAANAGPILDGYAVSTGRVTAPASVIHSIADFEKMAPGSILVCTTTTPAWTPLFSQAVGLVTDVGGALAHGSIVAREYGIPAVMGTGIATERIQSGMMLAVDGDAGTVTLVDEIDEQEEARIAAKKAAAEQVALQKRKRTAEVAVIFALILAVIWWRRRS